MKIRNEKRKKQRLVLLGPSIVSQGRFLFLSVLCTLVSVLFISLAYAALDKGPAQKFGRGLTYIVASGFQIPKEIIQTAGEAEPTWLAPWNGMTIGLGSGLYHAGRQLISGFWDLFTFWTPAGRDWAPLFERESFVPKV